MTATSSDAPLPAEIPEKLNIAEFFLDRQANRYPQRIAIAGEPLPVTYAELSALASRAANAFHEQGVSRGDRVLIVLPDSAEFMAAFFGAAKIGALAVPVNPFARTADYIHYIEDSEPSAAVVCTEALEAFLPASGRRPQMPIIVVGDTSQEQIQAHGVSCANWSACLTRAAKSLAPAETASSDAAFMLYTSGSGGTPKAAVHSHADMLAATRDYAQGVLELRADDVGFSASKLFFAYGLGNGMYFPLSCGASTILDPLRTSVDRVVALVSKYRPTIFFAVPTLYAAILQAGEAAGGGIDFSSVRRCVSAGETLPAEIFARWKQTFGLEILDGIGSTEMLHIFISSRPGGCKPGSCGFPVPGYDAKIVDDSGDDLPPGETGNLWVRGASAFSAYWRIPDLTARTKRDGWIVTGDKFLREPDGHYHYCGRADDMLKVAGMWVSPVEVENAVLSHPRVAETAVVGTTDARGLTYAVAYVTLRSGFAPSDALAEEIRGHVKARLVSHKVPREVRFCGELPKTATGKIQRFKLRGNVT